MIRRSSPTDMPGPVPRRHEPGHVRDDVRHRPRAADTGRGRNPHRSGAARRVALRRRCRVGGPEPGTEDASRRAWTNSSNHGARIRESTRPWPSFAASRRSLKRSQLSSEEWQKHDRAYHETSSAAEQIREQVRKARGEQGALKRIKSAIPLVASRRRLTTELNELGDVIRLRDDFGDEFRKAQDQLRLAEHTITRSRATLEEIDARLAQLDPPPMLLDAASEIESLQERLGAVEKASQDRVRLENFQQDAEHQARRILRDLARTIDLDEAETLRLRADEPTMIRGLGQRFAQLRGQAEEARKTIARHEDQIKRQEKELADLEQPLDVEPLRRAVSQARKAGDLDARLAETRGQLALAEQKSQDRPGPASGLEPFGGRPGAPGRPSERDPGSVRVPAPGNDKAAAFARRANRQRKTTRSVSSSPGCSLWSSSKTCPPRRLFWPRDERRDQGWQLVKAAWLDRAPAGEDHAAFLAEFAPKGTLASAYEQSVARSDALADRLRREADRVAHKAESLAQLNRHRTTRATLVDEGQALDDRQARIERDWNALVGPLAIETELRTPAELRAWLRQREEVVQLLEKVEEIRQNLEPLEQTFNTKRAAISRILDEMGEPLSTHGPRPGRGTGAGRGGDQAARRPVPKAHEAGNQARDGPEPSGPPPSSRSRRPRPSWPPGEPSGP